MKSATSELLALLAENSPFNMADVFAISIKSASFTEVFYYTNADIDIFDPSTGDYYSKNGPLFEREKVKNVVGLESSTISVTIYDDGTNIITSPQVAWYNGLSWISAIEKGLLDGSKITIKRYLKSGDPTSTNFGFVHIFSGEARDVRTSHGMARFSVVSNAYKFDMALPKNTFMPGCANQLYDSNCKVSLANSAHYVSRNCISGTTNFKLIFDYSSGNWANIASSSNFIQGSIECTSGANKGLIRTIENIQEISTKPNVFLNQPFIMQPSVGDTFILRRGCSRTRTACTTIFSNGQNYRGYPYVPNPEAIT